MGEIMACTARGSRSFIVLSFQLALRRIRLTADPTTNLTYQKSGKRLKRPISKGPPGLYPQTSDADPVLDVKQATGCVTLASANVTHSSKLWVGPMTQTGGCEEVRINVTLLHLCAWSSLFRERVAPKPVCRPPNKTDEEEARVWAFWCLVEQSIYDETCTVLSGSIEVYHRISSSYSCRGQMDSGKYQLLSVAKLFIWALHQ